jgi:2',3'-cyclic-nucleotide 2'-phosphodiesterase (5'-nucleotidase family)
LKIGIIGLANQDTPSMVNPTTLMDFEFIDYDIALQEVVTDLNAVEVDLILVASHLCRSQLIQLAASVEDLGISFFGGGHCHERFSQVVNEAVLLGGGSNLRSYAYATFTVSSTGEAIQLTDFGTADNQGGTPDPQVADIAARWQERTDAELDVGIGHLAKAVPNRSDLMAALITEAWLWSYPADIAITNWGGMRADIPAGDITIAHIINVMPFDNVLMDVSLTGDQLIQVLESGDYLPAVGGLYLEGGKWYLKPSGAEIDLEATYNLLTTDFLYQGGDDYQISKFDPLAYNTAINWRQPVIDWILAQESSPTDPLDEEITNLMQ